jgi:hypothetical protein
MSGDACADCLLRCKISMVHDTSDVEKHNVIFTSERDTVSFGSRHKLAVHWKHCLLVSESYWYTQKSTVHKVKFFSSSFKKVTADFDSLFSDHSSDRWVSSSSTPFPRLHLPQTLLYETLMFSTDFLKTNSAIKFHENPSSGSRVV